MDIFPNIDKVGIEMEGGWDRSNPFRHDLKGDCSVQVNDDDSSGYYDEDDEYVENEDSYINGELVSDPLKTWDAVKNFMENGYPDKVNGTCGLHVHISVPSIGAYEALATERFYNFMKFSLRVWGKKNGISSSHQFWSRLAGKNHYCDDVFQPEEQIFDTSKSGARYAIINYCFSYHGTMEIRVLPMFNKPKVAISAVRNILWTTNKFLSLPGIYSGNTGGSAIEEVIEMDVDHEMMRNFMVSV